MDLLNIAIIFFASLSLISIGAAIKLSIDLNKKHANRVITAQSSRYRN